MTKSCEYGRRFAGGDVKCDAAPQPGSGFCAAHLAAAQKRVAEAAAEAATKFKVYRRPDPGKVLWP